MGFTPSLSGLFLRHARSQGLQLGCPKAAVCTVLNADLIKLADLPGMEVATLLTQHLERTCLDR